MTPGVDPAAVRRGHENDTTSARGVLAAVAATGVGVAATLVACCYLQPIAAATGGADPTAARPRPPDFSHAADWVRRREMRQAREAERERLDSYGWVDRAAGIVHVPVQRAAELLLHEGLQVAVPPSEGMR